jgi:hypothetical protein
MHVLHPEYNTQIVWSLAWVILQADVDGMVQILVFTVEQAAMELQVVMIVDIDLPGQEPLHSSD